MNKKQFAFLSIISVAFIFFITWYFTIVLYPYYSFWEIVFFILEFIGITFLVICCLIVFLQIYVKLGKRRE